MKRFLAFLLLWPSLALAQGGGPVYPGGSTYLTAVCYPEDKNLIAGKYPTPETQMRCIFSIKDGKEEKGISTVKFDTLMLSYNLLTTFDTKDRVLFYLKLKNAP